MLNAVHKSRFKTLLPIIIFSILLSANAEEKSSESYANIAKKAAEATEALACKAIVAKETAFNAVENAMAIQNDAEVLLLNFMKENNKNKIKSAKKNLENASEEFEEARDLTEKIINYTQEALIAAEKAKNEAKNATDATSKKDAETAAKKATQSLKTSEKNTVKIETLTEELKNKWLVRKTTKPAPEAATTKQNSSAPSKKQ